MRPSDSLLDPPGLHDVIAALKSGRRFLICTHARPDADALGSELGLARVLGSQGKECDLIVEGGTPADLRFLPGSERVGKGDNVKTPYDAVVIVDAAGIDRIEGMRAVLPKDVPVVNIDHHGSNPRFGKFNWVEPEFGSVGEMIYLLARTAGWEIDRDAAVCLYTATYTDTGRFSFSSTRPSTHLMAADLIKLGVDPGDIHREVYASKDLCELRLLAETIRSIRTAEGGRIAWAALTQEMFDVCGVAPAEGQDYVSLVKSIKGVEVAILLRPLVPGKIKVSMRTEPSADAAAVCQKFGGGGHKRAAGATVEGTLEEVTQRVVKASAEELGRK